MKSCSGRSGGQHNACFIYSDRHLMIFVPINQATGSNIAMRQYYIGGSFGVEFENVCDAKNDCKVSQVNHHAGGRDDSRIKTGFKKVAIPFMVTTAYRHKIIYPPGIECESIVRQVFDDPFGAPIVMLRPGIVGNDCVCAGQILRLQQIARNWWNYPPEVVVQEGLEIGSFR